VFLEGVLASSALCKSRRRILCKAANRFRGSQIARVGRSGPSPLFVDPFLGPVNVTTRHGTSQHAAVALYTPLIRICWSASPRLPGDIFTASSTPEESASR